ncbi:trihelix transcription factor GTL1-like [Andrographis paniculata]|uniref:trihelix transcription factor GTL1-like n=1 Tax=Andrographis paniculata TaxID=175694 RepID=UPI0021E7200B|nr:trihelix transcription factor GTL1-like [Andrographis paniculata]
MLDSSLFLEASGAGAGGASGGSAPDAAAAEEEMRGEEGDRASTANRWPREETLALLKIRSDMDLAFRDSALKAPLWDQVSRKLGELGYNRSAKKCKEKFENIYKYHKRTKDGRSARHNGKTYRFFDQLELLDTQLPSSYAMAASAPSIPCPSAAAAAAEFMSASTSTASSSERDSDGSVKKKKRKLVEYFERLMKEVLEKQEDLQNKFLEALEKCEKDRMAREEAWKAQEMARIKQEQEYLAQERAIAAEKDAAVLAFLQKITQQALPFPMPETLTSLFDKRSDNNQESVAEKRHDNGGGGGGGGGGVAGETSTQNEKHDNSDVVVQTSASSSRWPKAEVEALITLKTDLDLEFQDTGPKGSLWEEVSSRMKKIGYERSSKRCKEKWENINKYYKRVKDSNRKRPRPEDSKTCPYFNMLESLYAKRAKKSGHGLENGAGNLKPEQILMQMVGGQDETQRQPENSVGEYCESDRHEQEDGADDDEQDRDDAGEGYRVVGSNNNLSSVTTLG